MMPYIKLNDLRAAFSFFAANGCAASCMYLAIGVPHLTSEGIMSKLLRITVTLEKLSNN